jgi:hypothetical protein
LSAQEPVQSFIGGPPFVILHSNWALAFEKLRMCSNDKKRNILFGCDK